MKKTKSCIALICAVVMLMTAFVVVPATANAEDGNICYATLTNTKNNVTTLSSNGGYGKITCESNGSVKITAKVYPNRGKNQKCEHAMFITLTKKRDVDNKKDIHSWKMIEKTYGNVTDKVTHKTSYGVLNEVTTNSLDGVDSKFDLQRVFEMNCDYSDNKITTVENNDVNRYLTVDFDVANYAVTNNFRLYSNTDINKNVKVSNKKPVFYKTNNSPVFINFDDRNSTTKKYDGTSNITIKNLEVNCTYNKKHYGEGFMYAAHGSNLNIDNITVENSLYAGHVFQITAMKKVSITNSCFQNLNYLDRNNNYLFGVSYADKQIEDFKKGANNKIANFNKTSKKTMKLVTSSSYFERLNFSNEKSYKHKYQKESYYRKQMKKGKSIKFVDSNEKSNCILTNGKFYNHEVIQIEPDYADTNGKTFALPTIKMSNDGTVCDNITISGCKFNKVMRAIGNHSNRCKDKKGNPKQSKNIYIKNNTFEYVVGHGITLINYSNVHIAKNKFQIVSDARIGGYPIYGVKYLVENKWESPFGKSIDYMKKNNVFSNVKNGRKIKTVTVW